MRLLPPPVPSPTPIPKCLPCPFMSKSKSEGRVERDGGTTGALCSCQDLATTAAAALSAVRATGTVFTIAFVGRTYDATLAHRVYHDMPRCQILQKVHPLIMGRGVLRRSSLVFSPCRRWRRGLGAGFASGSSSLAAPQPYAFWASTRASTGTTDGVAMLFTAWVALGAFVG